MFWLTARVWCGSSGSQRRRGGSRDGDLAASEPVKGWISKHGSYGHVIESISLSSFHEVKTDCFGISWCIQFGMYRWWFFQAPWSKAAMATWSERPWSTIWWSGRTTRPSNHKLFVDINRHRIITISACKGAMYTVALYSINISFWLVWFDLILSIDLPICRYLLIYGSINLLIYLVYPNFILLQSNLILLQSNLIWSYRILI